MELKSKLFNSWKLEDVIVKFIKADNIKRENIFIITEDHGSYTLFYYA